GVARLDVDREVPSEAAQIQDDRYREFRIEIEATYHVRTSAERNHRVAAACRELEETRDRVLFVRIDDEVGDMVDARGSQADEILVAFSRGVRHARDIIAREIP